MIWGRSRAPRGANFEWRFAVGDVWRYTSGAGTTFRVRIAKLEPPGAALDYGQVVAEFVDEALERVPVEVRHAAGALVPVGRLAEPMHLDVEPRALSPGAFRDAVAGSLADVFGGAGALPLPGHDDELGVMPGVVVIAVRSASDTPEAAGFALDRRADVAPEVHGFAPMLEWAELVDVLEGRSTDAEPGFEADDGAPVDPMAEAAFWSVIERSRKTGRRGAAKQPERVRAELATLAPADVAAFAARFDDVRERAYTWDLWAACVCILGGSSDDLFTDFRSWLVAQGREVFTRALADADSLAGLPLGSRSSMFGEVALAEEVAYAAGDVYEQATGRSLPPLPDDALAREPDGVPIREDADGAELARRVPRLARRFGVR